MTDEVAKLVTKEVLKELLMNGRNRRKLLCAAMVKDEWSNAELDRLVNTVDAVADAFGLDPERMLLAIGRGMRK